MNHQYLIISQKSRLYTDYLLSPTIQVCSITQMLLNKGSILEAYQASRIEMHNKNFVAWEYSVCALSTKDQWSTEL